jgi:hypothetical protein
MSKPLHDFAMIPDMDQVTEELAELAEDEEWDYHNTESDQDRPILHNYIHYTFKRIDEEEKVEYSEDNEHSCFNTGLVTPNQEPVYMLFELNKIEDIESKWHYDRFVHKGEYDMNRFKSLPKMAHYFDDPSQLVFDTRLEVRANIDHIIEENKERFPSPFDDMDDYVVQTALKGAIQNAQERVKRNYKAAVPQYYKGGIQLLLPLCLNDPSQADLALVVERHEGFYRAATCLTIDMAYNNARQLARPAREWLQP